MENPFFVILEQDSRSIIDLSKIAILNHTESYLWVDTLPIESSDNRDKFISAYSAYNELDEDKVRSILIEDSNDTV